MMVGIGVIGFGYWGPNLVRNFVETGRSPVACVADLDSKRLALVRARYPSTQTTADPYELIASPAVDAVAIATPLSTHFDLALATLKAGKHVLIEKPMTATSEQALRLIEQAGANERVLMVDHTFVYTSAVQKIGEIVARGDLGQPYYYDSVRVNLGIFNNDANVIWDLAVHDLSILNYLLHESPTDVSAIGLSHVPGGGENIAYLTLFFSTNFIAHIHVNWLAPVKIRRTLIGGSRRMVVYDDLEGGEKVKVYDKGINFDDDRDKSYRAQINYRSGDMSAPHLENTEALKTVVAEFIDSIETGRRPLTDGRAGLRVVRTLEAAAESMAQRGRVVSVGL
jgi:predicted dehydrogenase